MAERRQRLVSLVDDGLRLLACWLAGTMIAYTAYEALLVTVLEPEILAESSLRISRNAQLVEKVLAFHSPNDLPPSVLLRRFPQGPPGLQDPPPRFERTLRRWILQKHGLDRRIVRDRPPLQDPLGGHWIEVRSPRQGSDLWVYYPQRLSSTPWYLPMLRLGVVMIGILGGTILFLAVLVERPLRQISRGIPDTARPPLPLLPERGISPIRQLSLRVNRLLERLNSTATTRRDLLRGLMHDLSGPHSRLMLRVEQLQGRLPADLLGTADAMAADLQQLSNLTSQLGLLAEQDHPSPAPRQVGLDDLCQRLMASFPAHAVHLTMPRLLVTADPVGLERALLNLIDNALEHGVPPVLISARVQRRQLQIRVDDHGPGMGTATLLTMPRQPKANDRQRRRHLGLGLEIVERFCRDHGGQLQLSSSPSGGLRAELVLPQP
ncbi:MAG: HAMP domain-containing sensor histidine kinase [Cyanobacteriota bacterium]|nr:HAMP domain-containing sensor histidine kinase [Cyanobacteriota bacterium]